MVIYMSAMFCYEHIISYVTNVRSKLKVKCGLHNKILINIT